MEFQCDNTKGKLPTPTLISINCAALCHQLSICRLWHMHQKEVTLDVCPIRHRNRNDDMLFNANGFYQRLNFTQRAFLFFSFLYPYRNSKASNIRLVEQTGVQVKHRYCCLLRLQRRRSLCSLMDCFIRLKKSLYILQISTVEGEVKS